jgi:shikimate dehydrogenase
MIEQIYRKLSCQMQNIVLIGMPGCGKSTVSAVLGKMLGRKAVDADEEIIRLAGKTIPAIFAEDGEEAFRSWETQALSILGKQSGLILATGGGCITRERNYPLLHQNGTIFWLKRALDQLPTDGRPLSQANKLSDLYRVRKPLYASFADFIIDNNTTPDFCVREILRQLEEHS